MKGHLCQNRNADIRHLLDSLVSTLAVYAFAFRFKLYLDDLLRGWLLQDTNA